MKSLFSVLLMVLVFSFLNRNVCAQGDGLPNRALDDDGPHSKMDPGYPDEWGRERPSLHGASSSSPQREAQVLKKGILAPSLSERAAFADFLQQPNTGLIRLLPCELCDGQNHQSKNRTSVPGGGAFYSFLDRTHSYGQASDLGLDQYGELLGRFAGADYGILTILGDVPLDQISEKDPRRQFLSSYQRPAPEHRARAEAKRFRLPGGVTIDGLTYQWRLPVIQGSAYLLRSISDNRGDVLVAFRVIRKDADGEVTIAWRLLQKYRAPALHRGK